MKSPIQSPQDLPVFSPPATQFYTWRSYRCAYEQYPATRSLSNQSTHQPALLLVHPIGVGLSRQFWHRFCQAWLQTGSGQAIYNPDLLGCGESDAPHVAYQPADWAEQLQHFIQTVVQQPVVVVIQGALMPVAIALTQLQSEPNWIQGLILAGPPAWAVTTKASSTWQNRLIWNLLDSPLGNAFYRYARRPQFLRSFSTRQLFGSDEAVDLQWIEMLVEGAANPETRHAVFAFLAGFWRQDYQSAIEAIAQPTLVVVGETASSISQAGKTESPDQRLQDYLKHLPQGQGVKLSGRNVLPYESTLEFVETVKAFMSQWS